MRLSKPKMPHAPEVYAAVIVEFKGDSMLMAKRLEDFGWPLVDAARAAVEWSPSWLAAAIVHEREKRDQPPTITPPNSTPRPPSARKTTRIIGRKKPNDK